MVFAAEPVAPMVLLAATVSVAIPGRSARTASASPALRKSSASAELPAAVRVKPASPAAVVPWRTFEAIHAAAPAKPVSMAVAVSPVSPAGTISV